MDAEDVDQRLRDIQREYVDFLDDEGDQGKYAQLVKNMLHEKQCRLLVNVNDLRRKNPERAKNLLNNAFDEQIAFQKALHDYVSTLDYEYSKNNEFFIAFEGSFGNKHVTPRSLSSRHLGNLICVEGIVTKCSLVKPKVVRSVHYCEATAKVIMRKYSDLTSLDAFPSSSVYPTKDEEGNPLETEYGLSAYKDHQTVSIQEMPEKAPAGQLPRSLDIIVDDDLVDICKPGDRVQIVGTYRCLPGKFGNFTSGTFRTVVIANNLQQMSKEASATISIEDVAKCKNLVKSTKNVFELLAKSLAPSIHGHEFIKRAILCLLLGGVEKVLENGTRLRGDINVLLIGDPSVAKSQLLRYVLATAPRAIPTTGRGSSGVGLTAAVTTDQESGERRLEAGAMVLADRGVVCIDEFDKMSDIDRTAIHEVMEQGRVTIAKAGIHASLNARCSVLAAANPVYGKAFNGVDGVRIAECVVPVLAYVDDVFSESEEQLGRMIEELNEYDQYKTPMENIGLQDSLLSRFDLLFVMLDTVDEDHDMKISDHVVRMHRYRNPLEQDGEILPMGSGIDLPSTYHPDVIDGEKETPMYEKYDPLLHGSSRKKSDKILSVDFMRKYIRFVKIMKPTLTEEACEIIADEYSRLRSEDHLDNDVARTQPVTARSLETMIRLSTAHAKARMSREVTAADAHAAIELVQYAYFKKVLEKEKRNKRRRNSEESEDESEDEENINRPKRTRTRRSQGDTEDPYEINLSDEESQPSQRSIRSQRAATSPGTNGTTPSTNGINGHAHEDSTAPIEEEMEVDASPVVIADDRFGIFKTGLQKMFREGRTPSLPLLRIKETLNSEHSSSPFSEGEVKAALYKMQDENQVMIADDIVILI